LEREIESLGQRDQQELRHGHFRLPYFGFAHAHLLLRSQHDSAQGPVVAAVVVAAVVAAAAAV
jgi:hypothetical protein